jgi:hypothetical protein
MTMPDETLFEGSGRIGIRLDPADYSVAPGGRATIPVFLLNRGDAAGAFELSVTGIPTNWLWVASPVISLAPGEQREVQITVQPPRPPQGRVGRFPLTVRVASQEDPAEAAESEAHLTVAALEVPGRIGVLMAATEFAVEPGGSVTVPLVVLNRGMDADAFRLGVAGIPMEWVSTEQAEIRLRPGEQREVALTVQLPRTSQSRAGRHVFQVQVGSEAVPGQAAEAECTLTVGVFSEFKAALQPERVDAGASAWVRVENRGNVQGAYTVSWESPNDALTFQPAVAPGEAVPVQELRVPAGETRVVEFTSLPRRRPLFGGEVTYPFMAQVGSAERETRRMSGEVVGRGLLPTWVVPAFVVLALAFACVLILPQILPDRAEVAPTEVPTQVPPTEVPPEVPTEVPPTEVPTEEPTEVPPEEPTEVPPTEVPPEEPTEVPPTEVPPEEPTEPPPEEQPPEQLPEPPPEEQPPEQPEQLPEEPPQEPGGGEGAGGAPALCTSLAPSLALSIVALPMLGKRRKNRRSGQTQA